MKTPLPFAQPIYVTRPTLPDLNSVQQKLESIWRLGTVTNMGPQHHAFEKRLQDYLKVPYLSLFCNGTLALQLGCQTLRLSGEIITTPFTFPATTHVLYWNRIQPVFGDIDPQTYNLDPDCIEALITPETTAIMPVHVFGYPCDTERIQQIADRHGLRVIYDAAHAFGVEKDGIPIGNFGDAAMFSFHATKVFHSIEGGALTYNDPCLKERLNYSKNFGFKDEETIVVPGINAKMNEIQAAIGLLMLEHFEGERQKRKQLTEAYHRRLTDIPGLEFRICPSGVRPNYYNMVVTIDENIFGLSRDQLNEVLKPYNIITRKYFYPLCSHFQCYRRHPSSSPANLTVAEGISRRVLTLPLFGAMQISDVDQICDVITYVRHQFRKSVYRFPPTPDMSAYNASIRLPAS